MEPLWESTARQPAYGALAGDLDVDVCVVGAGITGITLAYRLGQAGLRVAVLEANDVGAGTTGHTSAHLTWMPDRELYKLRKQVGLDRLGTMIRAQQEAIDEIERLSRSLALDAEFVRVPGWRYRERGQPTGLDEDRDVLDELGIASTLVSETPLPFPIESALRVDDQAMFHPLKYLYGLAERLPDNVTIHTHSRVVDWSYGSPCSATTKQGTVRARELVFATHTPPGRVLRVQSRVAPYMSWLLALRLERPLTAGLYWDMADPYHYHRPFSADQPDIALIGGFDHRPGARAADEVIAEFEEWARERFPVVERVRAWAHEVFEPTDGLPYIGAMPGMDHIWVATGYSGTGLTFGTAAAIMLAELVQGRRHPWEQAFAPSRLEPARTVDHLVKENLENALHFFGDRLKPGGDHDVSTLKFGEGRIIREGVHQLAVYRDDRGRLHALSPVCTHTGCIVGWNGSDRTWDCPCHGGRYDAEGEPVYGPPLSRLARRTLEND